MLSVLRRKMTRFGNALSLRGRTLDLATRIGRSRMNPHVRAKLEVLDRPVMREMVERAARLEPLIHEPGGPRKVTWPPRVHDCRPLFEHARGLQDALGTEPVDTAVLLPHVRRLSGASRCGMHMARAFARLHPGERVLVVLTDRHEPPLPDGGEVGGVEVFDFAGIVPRSLRSKFRRLLLLDMLTGLCVRRIVNVNSRLGWDLFVEYGSQLRSWADLYAYLFCWDLDRDGRRTGYPVRELQGAFSSLDGIFFDSRALRKETVERYLLPATLRERLVTVYTPADEDLPDLSALAGGRFGNGGRLRALWAGRLDRQKRPDVAFEIMRRLPEVELHMYGEPVFGDGGVRFRRRPGNVRLAGVYERFSELPLESFDFFLYTSEWDGLPTVLIQAGACGLPVVAADVGGVGDLVCEDTGWPVFRPLDPDAYVARIREMLADPAGTRKRARALRKRTLAMCNGRKFVEDVGRFLDRTSRIASGGAERNMPDA